MLNIKKISLVILGCALIVGCADNATLMPHGNNKYTVVALSYSENDATKAAMDKANKVCSEKMLTANVTKQNSIYQGLDKSNKAMMGMAGDLMNMLKARNASGSSHPEASRDDYKVIIDFTCGQE